MSEREPTRDEISRAAATWCGQKERETDIDDVRYFDSNWRFQPGLKVFVEAEIAKRPLSKDQETGR